MNTLPRLSADYAWSHACSITQVDPGLKPRLEWPHDRDRYGRLDFYDTESLRLGRIRANPMLIERPAGSAHGNKPGTAKILLQMSGRSVVEQGCARALLSPGEWTLYDDSRPYSITFLERSEQRLMALPAGEIFSYKFDIETLAARGFSCAEGCSSYLAMVLRHGLDTLFEFGETMATDFRGMAIHALRLALIEKSGNDSPLHRSELMCDRVRMYINRHLGNPNLCVDTLAIAMNCSKSYLHKVFSESGTTLSHYILNQRLEKCCVDIGNSALAGVPIAQIAYAWGFNSLSHFSTVFSRRYGMSPSQLRQTRVATSNESAKRAAPSLGITSNSMRAGRQPVDD